jgi:hypothetical protein
MSRLSHEASSARFADIFVALDARRLVSIAVAIFAMYWAYRRLFPPRSPNQVRPSPDLPWPFLTRTLAQVALTLVKPYVPFLF